ncbi:uncharacterized protein LOC132312176 [Cornus florida]|uniref:uncharacterized protein LOC132312176 n=1 Tax=Cornus florida TaxID=4283 RepID=UPI0028A1AF88|nr:uncharacterized protein LOC132312176 [Cornus florida]
MEYCRRYGVVIAVCLPLIAVSIIKHSDGREIRPSEHGLAYQNAPATGRKSPEMLSFFGGTRSAAASSNVTLPEARNTSGPSWWTDPIGGGRRGHGGDRVKDALLVASVVCGITGVALLLVAAFLFLSHYRKQRTSSPS